MMIKTIKFPDESVEYIAPSWTELNQLAFKVSKQILQAGQRFDRIVTLAKGGWPLTRSMVDFLQTNKVGSIGVRFYCGINQRLEKPEIYQDLPVSIKDERVLLFDDVVDTGQSIEFAKQHLFKLGVKRVTTAALFHKPQASLK
ncbi:MAG: hypothetical protein GF390_04095, partial [Candidatus Pacebacteria bacterium]|nr:hypothetical protein [Candidatus Paceibacterota bacterium]